MAVAARNASWQPVAAIAARSSGRAAKPAPGTPQMGRQTAMSPTARRQEEGLAINARATPPDRRSHRRARRRRAAARVHRRGACNVHTRGGRSCRALRPLPRAGRRLRGSVSGPTGLRSAGSCPRPARAARCPAVRSRAAAPRASAQAAAGYRHGIDHHPTGVPRRARRLPRPAPARRGHYRARDAGRTRLCRGPARTRAAAQGAGRRDPCRGLS